MHGTRSQARRGSVALQASKQRIQVQHITALPQPLLELILIEHTNTKDKTALRLTCKCFQKALDNNLTYSSLKARNEESWQGLKQLLERWQNLHKLKAVALSAYFHTASSLLEYLPTHITSLTLDSWHINLKELTKLPKLTSLSIMNGTISGLEYVSGLTSLHCRSVRQLEVAHLAPTLKQLSISNHYELLGMDQLTNLEFLEAIRGLPLNFFQTHSHLPLKHLRMPWDSKELCNDPHFWIAAPTTLTRLTLTVAYNLIPGVLPSSITHLQLPHAQSGNIIERAAAALPWLRNLEVSMYARYREREIDLSHVSKLTNLQSLGLFVETYSGSLLTCSQFTSGSPELAMAVERGLNLYVLKARDDLSGFTNRIHPLDYKAVWTTHA